ncbi:MAG: DUF2735 domain-containing protein [Xanthobacteraceae bacterium]|nr:DUF2735 domain-containing protein [Xanthobacteraceae bacterium]
MGRNNGQESATIYQFPVGGRTAAGTPRRLSPDLNTRLYGEAVIGVASAGSWYHEEAIRESQRTSREAQQKKPVVVPLTFPHH